MAIPAQHTSSSAPSSARQRQNASAITEIVLPAADNDVRSTYEMVLPMLSHLSQQCDGRWLTWITTTTVTKALLRSYGFRLQNVQIVRVKKDDLQWVLWEALSNGTSDMVVAEAQNLSAADFNKLDTACHQGNCKGLILRTRN